jgi:NodT family efflux transporter outer membrane factor (OMF) lipoprotein
VARWRTLAGLGALLLSVLGCAVGPDFVRPPAPPVERYTHEAGPTATVAADGQVQHFEPGAKIAADWWHLFRSPQLDAVVKEAVANNQSLQAAQATLRVSQEDLRAGYGVFFPQLDASFDATRQKFSPSRFGSAAPSSIFNFYTLAGTLSYVLDVFGGYRRTLEGLQAQVDYEQYTVQATYLTLLSNVVNAAIAQAAYRSEIEALQDVIDVQRQQVRLTEVRAEAGTVPYANVLSLRAQLAATEAELAPLRQSLSQTEHLLAALAGRTPAEWAPPQLYLAEFSLPADLPVTLPSDLVRRRPDVLASEALLHGASANIGVATANLLPHFTLSGTYGVNSLFFSKLFDSTSIYWDLSAGVTAPLFHGGTLWFQRQAAIETYQQSLASYRQVVLSAFAQVADTLRAIEHDAEALAARAEALRAAGQALNLLQANYQAGTVDYLQILTATAQLQQAKINYLEARALRLQDTVALFVALGGGWWDVDQRAPGDEQAARH